MTDATAAGQEGNLSTAQDRHEKAAPPALLRGVPRHVWITGGVFWLVFGAAAVFRVYAFQASYFDLGFMLDGLGNVLAGEPNAPIEPAGWSLFEDHFSPLLVLFAPVAALPGSAYLLVFVQAGLVGLATVMMGGLIETSGRSAAWRRVVFAAFVVAPGLGFAVMFDFHPTVAAAPLVVLFVRGLIQDVDRWVLIGGVGMALTREDFAVLVVIVALFHVARLRQLAVPVAAAAGALILWRLTAGGPQYFREASFSYVSASDPVGTLSGFFESAWADGLAVFFVIVTVLPWLMFRGWAIRPILIGALFYLPLLASALFNTKSVGFHYYVLVGVFAVWSLLTADTHQADLSDRRSAAAAGLILVAALIGPLGTGLAAPHAETVWEATSGAVLDASSVRSTHDALACLDPTQPTSMSSALTMVSDVERSWPYPSPYAPILTARGAFGDAEVAPTSGPEPDVVVILQSESNSRDFIPLPKVATVGLLSIHSEQLTAGSLQCLARLDSASDT